MPHSESGQEGAQCGYTGSDRAWEGSIPSLAGGGPGAIHSVDGFERLTRRVDMPDTKPILQQATWGTHVLRPRSLESRV